MARLRSVQAVIGVRDLLRQLQLLIGFLSLGVATLLFRIESRRLGRSEGADQALRLLSLLMAGTLAMLIAKRPEMPPPQSRLAACPISFTG
jgi:hypothetical protein